MPVPLQRLCATCQAVLLLTQLTDHLVVWLSKCDLQNVRSGPGALRAILRVFALKRAQIDVISRDCAVPDSRFATCVWK